MCDGYNEIFKVKKKKTLNDPDAPTDAEYYHVQIITINLRYNLEQSLINID